jgi:mono/diheme cytochrome c family protein
MLKKILKWAGLIVGGLIVLVVIVGVILNIRAGRILNGPYELEVAAVEIPTDEAALARGQHLAQAVSGCTDCHGPNLGGDTFMDEAPFGLIVAPNLTSGQGGIGGSNSDSDWVRAIRHGIGHDGRGLAFMPSQYYYHYDDEDLGAIIAYVKSVPPVDHQLPARSLTFPGTFILSMLIGVPAANLDHTARPPAPEPGATAAYGEFLTIVAGCQECHGTNLAGRVEETGPPPGPNLTPGGELANWAQTDFITAIRNGVTPKGKVLDPELMPWPTFGNMTDEELEALWLYLESLPARELGDNG